MTTSSPPQFLLLTNQPDLAMEAENAGIQRMLVDLERLGKAERQRGHDLFISDHQCHDIRALRKVLKRAIIVTRLDPWFAGTAQQIETVLESGAQGVMLAVAESARQVKAFVAAVDSRALVSVLVETKQGLEAFAEIARVDGVDELHIGLNDLALSYGNPTIFSCLIDRELDHASALAHQYGRRFGFGGVTDPKRRDLPVPPDLLLGEQARLGSSIFWLGRSFRESASQPGGMEEAFARLQKRLDYWNRAERQELEQNHRRLVAHLPPPATAAS